MLRAYDHEKWHLGLRRYCRLCAALSLDDADDNIYDDFCREFGFTHLTDSFYQHLGEIGYSWMDNDSILALYRVWQLRRA
jgi:hypothetical protein